MSKIVTRFAPSPTGSLHVGGVRTALYNMVYAKKMGGKFILRIEDTDEVRSTDESLRGIVRDLKWAGIDWHEGPSKNPNDLRTNQIGDNGPYFQSQRKEIYNKYIEQLLQEGKAYEKDNAIVFRMPREDIIVEDVILGNIKFPGSNCQDLVIRKSSGMPTFHFAVVIDDAIMGITHVIRGQEHLQNCWKHIALQKALGLPTPIYAHIPLIMNTDGSKMSKRQKTGQVNTIDFKKDGYLPEVLNNYLALLGWGPGNNIEQFDIEFMINNFDIKDIGKSNARFDYKKLSVFNGNKINELDIEHLMEIMVKYLGEFNVDFFDHLSVSFDQDEFYRLLKLYQPRIKTLKDFATMSEFFIKDEIKYNQDDVNKFLLNEDGEGLRLLEELAFHLSNIIWNIDNLKIISSFAKNSKKVHIQKVMQPIRIALTGTKVSPPVEDTLLLLGKTESLRRINNCLATFQNAIAK